MPISFAKIAGNHATVTFQYGEDSVSVTYYPGRVTEKTIAAFGSIDSIDATNIAASFTAFNETLAHLVKSWDVYDDEAETIMFPLEPVRLAELPVAFRVQVLGAILGDIRPEMVAPPILSSLSH